MLNISSYDLSGIMTRNLILLLTVVISLKAYTQNIRVVTEYLSPYQIKNQDGTLGGFSTDVIHALFNITEDTANITVMPWARAYEIAQTNKNILIYSIARTHLREQRFKWVGSLINEQYYFWGLKKRFKNDSYTIEKLKKFSIATTRGSNRDEYLNNNGFKNIYELVNEKQQLQMLFEKRIDLVIEAELTISEIAKIQGYHFNDIMKLNEINELHADLSIAFNKGSDPELIAQYQQAFQKIIDNGTLQNIKQKWHIPH